MLLRLAYLGITNAFALLRLLPGGDRDKDIEILSLRHQLTVLQRQLVGQRARFEPVDRAWLAALMHPAVEACSAAPAAAGAARHDPQVAPRPDRAPPCRGVAAPAARSPRTLRSIRALVLRLARENGSWGYRRVHGELLTLEITVAPSTVWEILREAGVDPAPHRATTGWKDFLRSQAHALLAADFIETVTLTGVRMYILTVIEHASRRIRTLGATAHPTAAWVSQAARNLVMDLQDAGCKVKYLIRDRDGKYPGLFDTTVAEAGIKSCSAVFRCPG